MPRSVLIISCFFPPVGGAGVQRVAKFSKYLPQLDWQPLVLTTLNPSVPLFDETLLDEIPESVEIFRSKTLEPSYAAKAAVSNSSGDEQSKASIGASIKKAIRKLATLILQPDPQILWLPAAYRQGKKIIAERKPDVIFVSAPPFSSLLLAALLARKSHIPLVLDYRDEWDISNSVWENRKIGRWSQMIQARMQAYVLRSASAVIATTKMSVEELSKKATQLNQQLEYHCIYNGFDAEDFANLTPRDQSRSDSKFTITYVGTLWNLTSIAPFVEALQLLSKTSPAIVDNIRLVIAGRRTADQAKVLDSLQETNVEVELLDYLDHASAIQTMHSSDCLLLLLGDYEFAGRVVPGKIFEYFATSNSIITISPPGEVWDLLEGHPRASRVAPADIQGIADILSDNVSRFLSNEASDTEPFDANRFERLELTKQLARVFEGLSS